MTRPDSGSATAPPPHPHRPVVRGLPTLARDLRHTLRSLLRRPGYAGVAVATLALGIGGSCAIFALLEAAVLRPLPFPESDRLAVVWGVAGPEKDVRGASPREIADWRAMVPSLEGLSVYDPSTLNLTTEEGVRKLEAELVTPGFLELLGATPALGRTLLPADERSDGVGAVVISDRFWSSYFGGDPEVLGRELVLEGRPFEVVGVARPGFAGLSFEADVWAPQAAFLGPEALEDRGSRWLAAFGRIAAGSSPQAVQAELDAAAARLAELYPQHNTDRGAQLVPLRQDYLGDGGRAIQVVFGGALLLLVIACANVANLQVVRAQGRQMELAVREALGASPGTILRYVALESLVLAIAGGALGVLLASAVLQVAAATIPAGTFPPYVELRLSPAVVAFAVLLATVTGGVVGAMVGSVSGSSVGARARAGRGSAAGWRPGRPSLQRGIVGFQVAMALVVVVAAGLASRSLQRQLAVEPGFSSEGVVVARLDLGGLPDEPAHRQQFLATLAESVAGMPGVAEVAVGSDAPFRGLSRASILARAERPDEDVRFYWHAVTPSYFDTLGIELRAGRGIGPEDHADAPAVAVVDAAFARRFWPDRSPIGEQLRLMGDSATIVGVADLVRYRSLTDRLLDGEDDPDLFLSLDQVTPSTVELLVRRETAEPLAGFAESLARAAADIDRSVAVFEIGSLEQDLADEVAMSRLLAGLLSGFGTLALLLSAVGLYGVTAFVVRGRRRELAIRGALGARPGDLRLQVVRQTFSVALVGLGLGLVGALIAGRLMAALLFEVWSHDPFVLGGGLVVLAATVLLAAWGPAVEASRVSPETVLRGD